MTPVLDHGSDELKQKYVARVASGECQASYCLSEADAGSDVSGMRTRAVRDGDHYVLTGHKLWITNAGVSDFYTVFAKTDPDAGHRGISCFVVEKAFPGFSVSKLERKLGVRGSPTGEIALDECPVPAENLIGDEGRGFHYAMGALDRSRPLVGAQALGIARGALELATSYVRDRQQFGSRLADFQGLQFMLADMATQVDAAALLVYRACSLLDAGLPGTGSASSMAKLFASDTAMRVTTDCVQLLGGIGYTKDMPAERFLRDAKITQIYEGTNQIQRVVIAKNLLAVTAAASRHPVAVLARADGLPAHRQCAHRAVQLVAGASHRRHLHPPHRGHRRRPVHGGVGRPDPTGHALGRSRLGRRSVPPEPPLRRLSRRRAASARRRRRVRVLLHRSRGARAQRSRR